MARNIDESIDGYREPIAQAVSLNHDLATITAAAVVIAVAISLALIPMMIRLAPALRLIDYPDARKVHVNPISRVGGWGIVLGALVAIFAWAPLDELVVTYALGVVVLFAFGTLDDRGGLGHYTKFVGQFLAVLPVVLYAGLYVESFPFLTDFGIETLAPAIAIPFTVFAMIGTINALNHSDGLDGLAGGEALITLSAVAMLAFLFEDSMAIVIAAAAIGGLLGFLRYNTHPASVFMGDGGSQFLGFTLAFLMVLLTQVIDPDITPSAVLLLLGLPIIDILVVLKKRVTEGRNWFKATKNHIHHRLLMLGFSHKESVTLIYSAHTLFVVCGVFLRYEPDWLLIALYALFCGTVFGLINFAEQRGWQRPDGIRVIRVNGLGVWIPRRLIEMAIPLYFISVAIWVNKIPPDFGPPALILLAALVAHSLLLKDQQTTVQRILIYIAAVFVVYLSVNDRPSWGRWWVHYAEVAYYSVVALSLAMAIRFSPGRRKAEFRTTAMDYLLVIFVICALLYGRFQLGAYNASVFIVVLGIILYGCEFLIVERRERRDWLDSAAMMALTLIALRAFEIVEVQVSF